MRPLVVRIPLGLTGTISSTIVFDNYLMDKEGGPVPFRVRHTIRQKGVTSGQYMRFLHAREMLGLLLKLLGERRARDFTGFLKEILQSYTPLVAQFYNNVR